MSWVYILQLTEYRDAGTIQSDWKTETAGNSTVENDLGGVTVAGTRAVIVSTRNSPDYQDMESLDYVDSITESKEIPKRGDSNFDPPVDLGNGFQLCE